MSRQSVCFRVFHLSPRKFLGQNFLADSRVIQNLANFIFSLFLEEEKKYLHEIGPGAGALSLPLLKKEVQILAVEKDFRAVQGLKNTLEKNYPQLFFVMEGDILKWSPQKHPLFVQSNNLICFGNIPYYITSDILFWFSKHKAHYKNGVFMVQDEVADRLQAQPGTKAYGRLSIRMQLFFKIQKIFVVPACCFTPTPQVNSAVILLTPKLFCFASQEEDHYFSNFTTLLFSARRKMLRRALLRKLVECDKRKNGESQNFWHLANSLNVTEESRPDTLSPQTVLAFHQFFWNAEKNPV
jgi:16S rRNA (adenine1518-N6/adenine1519-N6)-dimethyltransferase